MKKLLHEITVCVKNHYTEFHEEMEIESGIWKITLGIPVNEKNVISEHLLFFCEFLGRKELLK